MNGPLEGLVTRVRFVLDFAKHILPYFVVHLMSYQESLKLSTDSMRLASHRIRSSVSIPQGRNFYIE